MRAWNYVFNEGEKMQLKNRLWTIIVLSCPIIIMLVIKLSDILNRMVLVESHQHVFFSLLVILIVTILAVIYYLIKNIIFSIKQLKKMKEDKKNEDNTIRN